MIFSWLIFQTIIFHYGTYAKQKQSHNYMNDYSWALNQPQQSYNQFNYPQQQAAAGLSYTDNEYYYDDDNDDNDNNWYNDNDYYSDTATDTATDTSYSNDYNTLYNQYLWNNYWNQMAYNQMAYNQMAYNDQINRMYQMQMMNQQQQQQQQEYYNQYDEEGLGSLLKKLASKGKDKLKSAYKYGKTKIVDAIRIKYQAKQAQHKAILAKCKKDFGGKPFSAFKLSDVNFKQIKDELVEKGKSVKGARLTKQLMQDFFAQAMYHADFFKDAFLGHAIHKGKQIAKKEENTLLPLAGVLSKIPIVGGILQGFLKVDLKVVFDKIFKDVCDKMATLNNLECPEYGEDAKQPKVMSSGMVAVALKQFAYRKYFEKAIEWLGCKLVGLSDKYILNKLATVNQDSGVSMTKRMGMEWLIQKVVDAIKKRATMAFDDIEEQIEWTPEMFNDYVGCLRRTREVLKCFVEVDKKHGISKTVGKIAAEHGRGLADDIKTEAEKFNNGEIPGITPGISARVSYYDDEYDDEYDDLYDDEYDGEYDDYDDDYDEEYEYDN